MYNNIRTVSCWLAQYVFFSFLSWVLLYFNVQFRGWAKWYQIFSTFQIIVCVLIDLYTWSCFNICITAECPNACLQPTYPTLVYLLSVDLLQPHVFFSSLSNSIYIPKCLVDWEYRIYQSIHQSIFERYIFTSDNLWKICSLKLTITPVLRPMILTSIRTLTSYIVTYIVI